MLKRFRIFWLDGRKEVVVGEDIADACRKAGIQKGALAAMDYFKEFPFSKLQQRKNRRLERW